MMDELAKRFRARVLEILSLIADEGAQRAYQASVPHVDVPAELFNQWEEAFLPTNVQFRAAFDEVELGFLSRFGVVINQISARTPTKLPSLDEIRAYN